MLHLYRNFGEGTTSGIRGIIAYRVIGLMGRLQRSIAGELVLGVARRVVTFDPSITRAAHSPYSHVSGNGGTVTYV